MLNAQENSAPQLPPLPPEIGERAAESVVVVTPDEISRSRSKFQDKEVAKNQHLFDLKPVVTTVSLSSDPSAQIETIVTTKGANTYVNFLDSMGNPWPYNIVSFGSNAYKEGVYGDKETHVAEVIVLTDFVPSTLSVMLLGREKPLIFMLKPSLSGDFDISKTFVVPGQSPKSKVEFAYHLKESEKNSILNRAPSIDRSLNLFLDNTPPDSAVLLPVMDVTNIKAWIYKDKMIIRTDKRLTWPSAQPLSGMNGYKVYELPHASPTLTFVHKGKMLTARIPDDAISGLPRAKVN